MQWIKCVPIRDNNDRNLSIFPSWFVLDAIFYIFPPNKRTETLLNFSDPIGGLPDVNSRTVASEQEKYTPLSSLSSENKKLIKSNYIKDKKKTSRYTFLSEKVSKQPRLYQKFNNKTPVYYDEIKTPQAAVLGVVIHSECYWNTRSRLLPWEVLFDKGTVVKCNFSVETNCRHIRCVSHGN